MPEFILNVGSEVPLFLLLLALLGFRGEVRPRASVKIAAAPEAVFRLLDLQEGEMRRWQRTRVSAALIDPERQTYRLTFTTPLSTGATQSSQADFRIAERLAPHILDIERAGLEGRSLNNELLRMRAELRPEDQGTRLTLAYHWGSRPVLAQLLARADLWGSIYRLKGEAETGKPDYRTDLLITAAVALGTGVVTLGTFAYAFGWIIAVLLVVALLVHEFGHLLAYRLIGQPWGRLVFLPFLGGIAVPRIGFTSQAQTVFSAMMGPAFSIIVPLLALLYAWMELPYPQIAVSLGVVASLLNLFNLLPVEPLDGGVILRSLLARLMGSYARYGLIAMGLLLALAGWQFEILLLLVFGLLATLANIRPRKIDSGLTPMTRLEIAISAFAFVAVLGAYAVLLQSLMGNAAIQS